MGLPELWEQPESLVAWAEEELVEVVKRKAGLALQLVVPYSLFLARIALEQMAGFLKA